MISVILPTLYQSSIHFISRSKLKECLTLTSRNESRNLSWRLVSMCSWLPVSLSACSLVLGMAVWSPGANSMSISTSYQGVNEERKNMYCCSSFFSFSLRVGLFLKDHFTNSFLIMDEWRQQRQFLRRAKRHSITLFLDPQYVKTPNGIMWQFMWDTLRGVVRLSVYLTSSLVSVFSLSRGSCLTCVAMAKAARSWLSARLMTFVIDGSMDPWQLVPMMVFLSQTASNNYQTHKQVQNT